MSNLPVDWKNDRLKDVAAINVTSLPADTDPDYEFDYLEISNVNYFGIVDPNAIEKLRYEDAPSRARRRVPRNSTLISSVRPNLQAIAFAGEDREDFVCSTGFNVVEPIVAKVAPKFAYYTLISDGARQYFEATAKGVGYPAVDDKDFSSFNIPLPPLPEQQRIAAYLDASCEAIDAAVAAKRRQLETLDALRGSIITRTVTRGLNPSAKTRASGLSWLGNIPEHWKDGHLKRYARRIQTGVTPPTDTPEYYEKGTIPWFAPGSFESHIELTEPRKLINERALSEGALRMFPVGTVFVIGIGATIGKVGIIAAEASCNQQIIGIVCDHRMIPRFLAYQLKIYELVIPEICVATTLPIFNQVQVGYLPIVVPPVSEQQAICKHIDAKLAEVKKVADVLQTQIATLTAYRKSLIHECVTGQRRITEADVRQAGGCPPASGSRNSPSSS